MRINLALAILGVSLALAAAASAAASVAPPFYGDAPDDTHPWAVHDRHRPLPKVVAPGTFSTQDQPGKPPADAIVLFDGKDLSKWESDKDGGPAKWVVKDGAMEAVAGAGYIRTKEKFGDCQLHVEWAAPTKVEGSGQGRGNSGVFLPGGLEIQVLDNYNNPTYADGTAGAYYGINPPMVNALRPPGEYQVYDIVFRRPVYKDGKVLDPGYVTVFVNGVLVQDHTPLEGPGGHMRRTKAGLFPEKGQIKFQDHGNPVRFRNVWIRELPPRSVEGGTDGALTREAAMAKRKETAAALRAEAAKVRNPGAPLPELLLLMESLAYEAEPATVQKVEQMTGQYLGALKGLEPDKLAGKKDEVKNLNNAFKYLLRFQALPTGFAPAAQVDALIKEQGWDKDKKKK